MDQSGMRPAINHSDQCEEKGCHQTVRDHLNDGTVHGSLIHHQHGQTKQGRNGLPKNRH